MAHLSMTQHVGKLAVICHGNICRSPFITYLLEQLTGEELILYQGGLGPGAPKGRRVPKKIRQWVADNLDNPELSRSLEEHRSVEFTINQFRVVDAVVYMGPGNRRRLDAMLQKVTQLERHQLTQRLIPAGDALIPRLKAIPDPAFTPPGPELDSQLQLLQRTAEAWAAELGY